MNTTCVWSNPDDEAVTWGEGTNDEMCFNFLAYYPLQKDLSWVMPTYASDCAVDDE